MKSATLCALLPVAACALLLALPAYAQDAVHPCWTMEYLDILKKQDPSLDGKMRWQEEVLQSTLRDQRSAEQNSLRKTTAVITIPVVVHIVYNTPAQNIPDQRVFDQIAITNRDFAGLNPHSMYMFPHSLKADMEIQYCLAQKAPDGSPTTGIERVYTTKTMFTGDSIKYTRLLGADAWDPTIYMNIWVCNTSGVCWGRFPGTGATDAYGVVMHHVYFGYIDSTFNMGSGGVTTHELGHCLNLRHTWGDDGTACTGSDMAADTPNEAGYTSGYHTGLLTDVCSPVSPGIMYMNFMDYTSDRVLANFTPDQKARAQACFASPSGPLLPLLASTACSAPSSCEVPTSLKAGSLTRTKATVSWTAMVNSIGYNVRYRKVGTTTWSSTSSPTNSKLLTGLIKNTFYEFQVQNICSSTSAYSPSKTFQTPKTGPAKENSINETEPPEVFTLFPNPTADYTNLFYTLTETGLVSIHVFNSTGADVDYIAPTHLQDAGTYTFQYNVSHLPAGMYFIRITAGPNSSTRLLTIRR